MNKIEHKYFSWNSNPRVRQKIEIPDSNNFTSLSLSGTKLLLPRGCGRSYGDVCLNDQGVLIDTRKASKILEFDERTGIIKAEAGVTLAQIMAVFLPQGWFPPVSPGTKFVTLGGAIANDVHGKNHHKAGTFGCHVRRFELVRSNGETLVCSLEENPEWYHATIGGLGLTGIIRWAELKLKPVKSHLVEVESIKFDSLDELVELSRKSNLTHEYTAAWVDGMPSNKYIGRGVFMRGNHYDPKASDFEGFAKKSFLSVPVELPFSLLNSVCIKAFNQVYFNKQNQKTKRGLVHFESFFYPLDAVKNWNRLYGKPGFYQHQSVIPFRHENAVKKMFTEFARFKQGSFFVVMKEFGSISSPGLMSFPKEGMTTAFDFPNKGQLTLELLDKLDEITWEAGGRVNPSKDARMSPEYFKKFYPQWEQLEALRDSRFSSSFWRRVTAGD